MVAAAAPGHVGDGDLQKIMTHSLPAAEVSVIVPVFNEEQVMPLLVDRLRSLQRALAPRRVQVLLIDDGSSDGTPALIDRACAEAGFVGIHFSRNFGHQAAVTAGIDLATGAHLAVIDGDLQDPPELIPEMLALLDRERADVAYGVRKHRKEHALKRLGYFAFYRLLAALSPLRIPLDSGDFCVMTSRVADAIRSMPEHHRFVRGLRTYAGFKQVPFEYSRDARAEGEPKYTFSKLLQLALDGIFSFSARPLQLSAYIGFVVSLASFCYAVSLIAWRVLTSNPIPGFATLGAGLFFLSGVQLISLGILGEYVGRIHGETKRRPMYVIESISRDDPAGTGRA
jgi:dolichol-phosphate mannosyltransferase